MRMGGSSATLSVAPMLRWTTPACRVWHSLIAPHALLYTEMVATKALLYGKQKEAWWKANAIARPVALQVAGSDPKELAAVVGRADAEGFCEINLNLGCPSKRAQAGRFGACMMKEIEVIVACIEAMCAATTLPISIKTRIRWYGDRSADPLDPLVRAGMDAGCKKWIVHARPVHLQGLNPAQNRTVPPLEYETLYRLKEHFPSLFFVLNGGIQRAEEVQRPLQQLDGVMVGRMAYERPKEFASCAALLHREMASPHWMSLMGTYMDRLLKFHQAQVYLFSGSHLRPLRGLTYGLKKASAYRVRLDALEKTASTSYEWVMRYREWVHWIAEGLSEVSAVASKLPKGDVPEENQIFI